MTTSGSNSDAPAYHDETLTGTEYESPDRKTILDMASRPKRIST